MKTRDNSKKNTSISTALYIGGLIVALMGIALLFNTIKLYSDTFAQAIAMGYDTSQVNAQLLPSQLLPGIFESIGLYGGISMILCYMGLIYQRVSDAMLRPKTDEVNIAAIAVNVSEITAIEEKPASTDAELTPADPNVTTEKTDEAK